MARKLSGDQLIERLLRAKKGVGAEDSPDADRLLKQIWKGYPLTNLRRLLHNDDDWVAAQGAWILAECGKQAGELLADLPRLATHRSMRVRYWAVDIFLFSADVSDLASTCAGFLLLEDPDTLVRSYAIRQFAKLPLQTLADIGRAAETAVGHERCAGLARQLPTTNQVGILDALHNPDASVRSAAMSAALRAGKLPKAVLDRAENSGDAALVKIAQEEMSKN